MRAVGYGLVGLVLGSVGGFWVGLMIGLIYTELASVSCSRGSAAMSRAGSASSARCCAGSPAPPTDCGAA